MEVYEAILAKRDRRSYDLSRQVPEDIIDRLLQAGRMAGSSKNEQPIRAIILTDSEIKASLSRCADYSDHLPTSPLVIVLVRFEGSRAFDAGRVAQNIMLAASGLGLDSCPVGVQHDDGVGQHERSVGLRQWPRLCGKVAVHTQHKVTARVRLGCTLTANAARDTYTAANSSTNT